MMTTLILVWGSLSTRERVRVCLAPLLAAALTYVVTIQVWG